MATNQKFVAVIDPNGISRQIPVDKVELALKSGGRLANSPSNQQLPQQQQFQQPAPQPPQMQQQGMPQPQQQGNIPPQMQQPVNQQGMIPNINAQRNVNQPQNGKLNNQQLADMLMKGRVELMDIAKYINERPQLDAIVKGTANFVEPIGNAIKGSAVGLVESGLNTGASVANLPIEAINIFSKKPMPTIPEANLKFLTPKNSIAGDASYEGSKILGTLLGANKAYGATKLIKGLKDDTNIAQNAIRGALSGFATGESEPGGRYGSATLGGLAGPLNNLSYKSIADQLVKKMNLEKSISSQGFDKFFRGIPGKGAASDNVKTLNDEDYKIIKSATPKNKRMSIDEFMKNPTIENAHYAQSALSGRLRDIKNSQKEGDTQYTALIDALENSKSELQNNLKDSLSKINPELSDKYSALKFYHARNVVPYQDIGLGEYDSGGKWANDIVKKIMKNREFMEGYKTESGEFVPGKGKEFKNLQLRKALDGIINKDSAKTAAAMGLAGYAGKYFLPQEQGKYYTSSGEN